MGIDARRILTGRRLLVTALAAAAVAGGGAATAAAAAQDDGDGNVPSGTRVTAVQAAQAALKAAPGTVEDIDLDDDGWEIDVVASGGDVRTVNVDAGSGAVVRNRADRDDDDDAGDRREAAAEAKALGGAEITAADAAAAALKAASGTVTSVDFRAGTAPAWEVEVAGSGGTEHEVTVDAASGEVLQNQADDRDDDDDDDRDDDQGDDD
ncbi:PepSY domain-containing protein [Actinomadura algeriensis]|uniref:Membrane protein YkoI n=1 Tax=Actinomadura algeriensis TaxID=1679523 RepID=A0ABR9JZA9_9ACTN|nr:PepSY domain-containing protein [Actinomadura algeriensis]MBE1535440.1 putative membrane protein YkoI [Actinomadura algeriensis]